MSEVDGVETVQPVLTPAILPDDVVPKRQRRWKIPAIIAGALALALIASLLVATHLIRRPIPRGGENLAIPGLIAPVTVTRDGLGVPRIYADHTEDLFRAQGYVDASERFFQMDYRRHVANGTLAGFVGGSETAIASDRVVRTMNWPAIAAAEWELLDPETQSILTAYAAGINAYLATRTPEEISLEYSQLASNFGEVEILPWKPTDSLAWLKVVAWEMRSNFEEELDRTLAYSTLQSVDAVNRLFPAFETAGNAPILGPNDVVNPPAPQLAITGGLEAGIGDYLPRVNWIDQFGSLSALQRTHTAINAVPRLVAGNGATGSNSWVVSGRYTESGLPIVANDPHMAITVPAVFAQVGLFCNTVSPACPFEVAGFSLPGFPGVYAGHNGQLAWGLTNLRADTTDLFVERVNGNDAMLDSNWRPMDVHQSAIQVAGDQPDIPITIRSIDGRPILSDIYDLGAVATSPAAEGEPGEFAVSLAWSGLVPGQTAAGLLALNRATNSTEVAAAAALITAPSLAIVFGTTSGDIGFQSAGLVPVRSTAVRHLATESPEAQNLPTDGTWPQDGRHSDSAWTGWVPASDMPRALNPDAGFIVAANQAVLEAGSAPNLGADFDYGFRAARISAMLTDAIAAGTPITVADTMAMQFDDVSPAAAKIVPVLRSLQLDSDWVAAGQDLLVDWDFQMDTHSAAAAYFASAWNHVLQLTFWDELPDPARPDGTSRWLVVLSQMLNDPHNDFWDDRSTLDVTESRDEVLRQALLDARNELTTRVSSNTEDWHWGALHQLRLVNPVLGGPNQNRLMQWLANPRAVSTSGSTLSVNSTAWPARIGEMGVLNGPAFRLVMDTGDWDNSTWVNVPGNSGHVRAAHYADQLNAWNQGEQFPFRFRDTAGQTTHLTFAPN